MTTKTDKGVFEQFQKDVAEHKLTIKFDLPNINHRHLRFKRPEEGAFWFDIVTWPNHLVIQGDMGCYVFSRVENMLTFFRQPMTDEGFSINPPYWGEKLQAHSGYKKFSPEYFEERVLEWCDEQELSMSDHKKLRASVQEDILDPLSYDGGSYESCYRAFSEFSCNETGVDGPDDLWDWGGFNEYEYKYLWCLWAIVWGIHEYDKMKNPLLTLADGEVILA